MAEYVQQSIEEMLPELEQIERVGICTAEETRKILKKRKNYEYKLRRRTKCKEDYLQYIQYELSVLKLVRLRRKKIAYRHKKKEIDVAIIHRIHNLFRLATIRFSEDVKLWLSHIEFAQSRGEKSNVSRIFTKLLQIHNSKPDLWILAAKWEWETNNSPENARHLLQMGLRYLNTNKQLWLEYFRMELLYAEKLRQRKTVLGIDESLPEADEMSDAVLEGQIAEVVHQKALENIPDDVDFILSFLPVCRLFDFTKPIKDKILSSLREKYSDRPQTWDALAREHLSGESYDEEAESKFHAVYEEALKDTVLPKDQIWKLYLSTCLEYIEKQSATKGVIEKRITKIFSLFEKAEKDGFLTEDLYSKWIQVLVNVGLVDKAEDTIKRAISQHSKSVLLWKQYLHLNITNNLDENEAVQIFKESQKNIPEKKSLELWRVLLDFCVACCSEKTEELFEQGVTSCRQVAAPLKEYYLQWMFMSKGIVQARKLYKRLIKSKPVSLQLFYEYFKLEDSQPFTKIEAIRKAYEDAVMEFGTSSSDLWVDFIKMEMNHPKGNPDNIGKLHYRALKQLDGELNQRFITEFTLLQTGHEVELMED